jgi:hypothetical protein
MKEQFQQIIEAIEADPDSMNAFRRKVLRRAKKILIQLEKGNSNRITQGMIDVFFRMGDDRNR